MMNINAVAKWNAMDKLRRLSWRAVAVVAATLLGAIYLICPYTSDDVWYMDGVWRDSTAWGRTAIAFSNVFDHWDWDTGRLANLVSPIFLTLLPKFVFAALTALAFILMLRLSRLISSSSEGSASSWIIMAGTMFALPWDDQMISVIYCLNYVWTTVSILAVIAMSTGTTRRATWLTFIVSVLAGWMHEGMTAPTIAGLLMYAIMRRKSLSDRRYLCAMMGLLMGLLLILLAPATWVRTSTEGSMFSLGKRGVLEMMFTRGLPAMIFLITLAIMILITPIRRRILDNRRHSALLALLATSTVTALIVAMACYTGVRNFWYPNIMSFIGISLLINQFRVKRTIAACIGAVVCICTLVNLSVAITNQLAITREYNRMINLYKASPTGAFFFERPAPPSPWALDKVGDEFFDEWMKPLLADYYGHPASAPYFETVPTRLMEFSPEQSLTTSTDSVWIYQGEIITAATKISTTKPFFIGVRVLDEWYDYRVKPVPFSTSQGDFFWLKNHHFNIIPIHVTEDGKINCWRQESLPAIPTPTSDVSLYRATTSM